MGVIGIGKIDRWAKFMEDFLPLSLRGPFPFQKWEGFQIIWKLRTFLNGPNPASFCLFSFFSHDKYSTYLTINDKRVGTQTQGGRMEGKVKYTVL